MTKALYKFPFGKHNYPKLNINSVQLFLPDSKNILKCKMAMSKNKCCIMG